MCPMTVDVVGRWKSEMDDGGESKDEEDAPRLGGGVASTEEAPIIS